MNLPTLPRWVWSVMIAQAVVIVFFIGLTVGRSGNAWQSSAPVAMPPGTYSIFANGSGQQGSDPTIADGVIYFKNDFGKPCAAGGSFYVSKNP